LAAVSFFFIAANPKLYLVPRYLVVTAWSVSVLVAWWLSRLWLTGRRTAASLVLGSALIANLAALSVENINPRMVEKELVKWVASHPGEQIYTDVETRTRSEFFFRFAGLPMDTVSTDRPTTGSRFFYNEQRVAQCTSSPRCKDRVADFKPTQKWKIEAVIEGPVRPAARLGWAIGLDKVLPNDIAQRVFAPVGQIVVFRVQ
jgi:hypothetical protein